MTNNHHIYTSSKELIRSVIHDVVTKELEVVGRLRDEAQKAESWIDATQLILRCRGKVILTGMGKSGLVAQKIAATMSSTGTVAIFMHPAEGMHGDLGVITGEDVVVALSKSGESEELNAILPGIRKRGAKVIAITADRNSRLAQFADQVVFTPVDREACPLNLAPTSSTTAALVAGDAIAMALMKAKGIKEEDFAVNHPGGKLGRRLLLAVRDVMIAKERCPVLNPESANMEDVLTALGSFALGVVVFSRDGSHLEGILTDGDIRRLVGTHKSAFFSLKPASVMNPKPHTIEPTISAMRALEIMESREKPLNMLVVTTLSTNENAPKEFLGCVRLHDLVSLK